MGTSKENDDEVLYEVDVYISKTLAEKLHLFHYPSKDSLDSPEKNSECLSAKIKPKQQKLELEFALDPELDSYDKSRGEQMAFNVDGVNPSGETFFNSTVMDKVVLNGAKAGSPVDNYAIGIIRDGEIHVTPLHSALELRQNFKYMDRIDSLAKKSLAAALDEEEEEEEAVAVTVRFEGPNAEKDKKMREKSYQYLQQKSANEPWINVNYHAHNSPQCILELANLTCFNRKDGATCSFTPEEYRKHLIPKGLHLSGYNSMLDQENTTSVDLPISDQIKHLMINAQVLKFSNILEKMSCDVDSVSVERLVQQIAVLVQGCWVVKSELLYAEDSVSLLTGVSGKYLISARDYVVWLFTKSTVITRQEVLSSIYVPDAELTSMISQIAVQTDKGWEFKFPYDSEFVESHRSVEQSQDIKWDLRYKKLVKELNLGMSDPDRQVLKLPCPVLPRKQKRLSRSSMSEDGDESGTDTSSSSHRDTKSKRQNSPKKRLNMSPSKHPLKSSKPYHIATLDVSPTFLETSPSDDIKSQLKECVEEAIRSQFVMTLSSLKELVSESHLSALCHRSDFETLLEDSLQSCGAQKLKNKWPQNTTPEPLYAFFQFGNKLDRYRNILLELFSTTARARKNLFVKTVEDELREIISEHDSQQIFEEYCTHKSGFFYLKGTISLDS